jgi:hypothetical protein
MFSLSSLDEFLLNLFLVPVVTQENRAHTFQCYLFENNLNNIFYLRLVI